MSTMEIDRSEVDSRRQWQAYFDERLRDIGVRAPESVLDQTTAQYCRAVCRYIKRAYVSQNHRLRDVKFDKTLPNDALYQLIPQVLDASVQGFNDPSTVPFGEFREKPFVDPATGRRGTEFIGQDNFCRFMGRVGRSVSSIQTPNGRYNVAKARYE
jgi:hypothetical protein